MTPAPVGAGENIKNAVEKPRNIRVPGFQGNGISCGLKKGKALDLGLLYSLHPCTSAAVFTRNIVQAAPVIISRKRASAGKARAILVNSGNANACTGEKGFDQALSVSRDLEKLLGLKEEDIFLASTGVIGKVLDGEKIRTALRDLAGGLKEEKIPLVAKAIMTTDTFPKTVLRQFSGPGGLVTIGAMAKGAGMIRPDMATMLCFVLTDAAIPSPVLQETLREAVEVSFNRITVDGDTSTNDCVLMLANGLAGNPALGPGNPELLETFREHLKAALLFLAKEIVRDGEGATKFVSLTVKGAPDQVSARKMAFTVGESYLVKTALFGSDANWGRLAAALGRCGIPFDPQKLSVVINKIVMVENGITLGEEAEKAAGVQLKNREIEIVLDLKEGVGEETIFTCDLSYDYIRINAAYRT